MNEAEKVYWFKTTKNPDLMFVYNLHNWYFKKFFDKYFFIQRKRRWVKNNLFKMMIAIKLL